MSKNNSAQTGIPSNSLRKGSKFSELDRIDLEILRLLANDGRLSNKQLASRLGLAPSSTHVRRKRLEREGYLGAARYEVAPAAFGDHLEALIAIRMPQHSWSLLASFRDYLLALPEVVQLFHMAGEEDFLLHVRARDTAHLKRFVLESLTTHQAVSHVHTYLVFDHVAGCWPGESRLGPQPQPAALGSSRKARSGRK